MGVVTELGKWRSSGVCIDDSRLGFRRLRVGDYGFMFKSCFRVFVRVFREQDRCG